MLSSEEPWERGRGLGSALLSGGEKKGPGGERAEDDASGSDEVASR